MCLQRCFSSSSRISPAATLSPKYPAVVTSIARKGLHRDYVRTVREQLAMSQDEFAEALGVRRETVNRWESGDIDPQEDRLDAIRKLVEKQATSHPAYTPRTEHVTPNVDEGKSEANPAVCNSISVNGNEVPKSQPHDTVTLLMCTHYGEKRGRTHCDLGHRSSKKCHERRDDCNDYAPSNTQWFGDESTVPDSDVWNACTKCRLKKQRH